MCQCNMSVTVTTCVNADSRVANDTLPGVNCEKSVEIISKLCVIDVDNVASQDQPPKQVDI